MELWKCITQRIWILWSKTRYQVLGKQESGSCNAYKAVSTTSWRETIPKALNLSAIGLNLLQLVLVSDLPDPESANNPFSFRVLRKFKMTEGQKQDDSSNVYCCSYFPDSSLSPHFFPAILNLFISRSFSFSMLTSYFPSSSSLILFFGPAYPAPFTSHQTQSSFLTYSPVMSR